MGDAPESGGSAPREVRRGAGGLTLRTLEQGSEGAPIALLLHGLPGGAEDWTVLGALLAPRFHVIAVDRPGYGGSGEEALSVAQQTEVFAALLAGIGDGPALVAGHSYGALPAARLAEARPDLVGALALLAPALREQRADRAPPPGAAGLQKLLAKPAIGAFVRATVLSDAGRGLIARYADPMTFDPDPVDPDHLEGVRERTLQWGALRSAAQEAQSLVRDGALVDARLGTIGVPSAVIHARGDRVVEPAAGRRTAASIPRCELHELDGGHMLTISRAAEVAVLIEALADRAALAV